MGLERKERGGSDVNTVLVYETLNVSVKLNPLGEVSLRPFAWELVLVALKYMGRPRWKAGSTVSRALCSELCKDRKI